MEKTTSVFDRDDLSPEYLKTFYNDPNAFTYSHNPGTFDSDPLIVCKTDLLEAKARSLSPARTLEVGCGSGLLVSRLSAAGLDVSATEYSSKLAKLVASRCPSASIKCADATRLPFADDTFDLVICSEVLEHIPAIDSAWAELVRVTRSGGHLLITVPNLFMYDSIEGSTGLMTRALGLFNRARAFVGHAPLFPHGYSTHLHKRSPWAWRRAFSGERIVLEEHSAIFLAPYVFEILAPLKRLERNVLARPPVHAIHRAIESRLRRVRPFRWLGQCQLFVLRKL